MRVSIFHCDTCGLTLFFSDKLATVASPAPLCTFNALHGLMTKFGSATLIWGDTGNTKLDIGI